MRVPERLQMTEEASAFFWEWTLALARTGDRAVEEFFKTWSDSFDGNPPILCLY